MITLYRLLRPFLNGSPSKTKRTAAKAAGGLAIPPAIVVFVDAWTSWGGSQFLDSPALGPYHSYLCREIVPWIDAHYRTKPEREHRAVSGKSSGDQSAGWSHSEGDVIAERALVVVAH